MNLTDHQVSQLAMYLLGTPYPLSRGTWKLIEGAGYFQCMRCSVWRSIKDRSGAVCGECAAD